MAYKCPVQLCRGKCFKSNQELFHHGEFTHKPVLKVYVCPVEDIIATIIPSAIKCITTAKKEHKGQLCDNKFKYVMVKNNNFIDIGYAQ